MEQLVIDERVVRKYLLGELLTAELEQIEERLLTDNNFFERLSSLEDEVEDELIDQYVGGELTEPERERFERVFLSTPERNEKLKLVKDLTGHVAQAEAGPKVFAAVAPAERRSSSWRSLPAFLSLQNPLVVGLALALLLAVACISWLLVRANRREFELKQLRAQKQSPAPDANLEEQLNQLRARNDELTARLQREQEQRAGLEKEVAVLKNQERQREIPAKTSPSQLRSPTLSLALTMVGNRGTEGEKINVLDLASNTTQAQLILDLGRIDAKDYKGFQAVVAKRGGTEVWRSNRIRSAKALGGQSQAIFTLPARRLLEGDYTVELSGLSADGQSELIGIYSFRVKTN